MCADASRRLPRAAAAFLWMAAVYWMIFFLAADMERLVARVPDDASYYLKIAENRARMGFWSFDGRHPTNGFQPLWGLVLVPFFAAFPASPEILMRAVLGLQIGLMMLGGWGLGGWIARRHGPRAACWATAFFAVEMMGDAGRGMESALVDVGAVALIGLADRWRIFDSPPSRRDYGFGLLLGMVLLSRLDFIFLALLMYIVPFLQIRRGRDPLPSALIKTLGIGLGASTPVLPYLLWNRCHFGHWMPISGALKNTFPHWALEPAVLGAIGVREWLILLSSLALPALKRWRQDRTEGDCNGLGVWTVGAAAVWMHALHSVLYMDWGVMRWHFHAYGLLGCGLVAVGISELERRRFRPWAMPTAQGLMVLALAWGAWGEWKDSWKVDRGSNWRVQTYRAAQWARAHTSSDTVLAMKDAGHFGFFSRRSVVNLDGLVNTFAYQEALRDRKLGDYLRDENICGLAQHAVPLRGGGGEGPNLRIEGARSGDYDAIDIRYRSRLYKTDSDPIRLIRKQEVYRSEPYGAAHASFVIWNLCER